MSFHCLRDDSLAHPMGAFVHHSKQVLTMSEVGQIRMRRLRDRCVWISLHSRLRDCACRSAGIVSYWLIGGRSGDGSKWLAH